MKVLLIGDFSGKGDEGLSQISKKILKLISKNYKVKYYNTKSVINSLYSIMKFQPDIVHYITGLTIKSLIISKLLKLILGKKTKIIISGIRIYLGKCGKRLVRFFKIDMILLQSEKWDNFFKRNNIKTKFLPNFIDTEKFKIQKVNINQLRKKYNLPLNKKIMLHIGHIKQNRNLTFLIENYKLIQKMGYELVIVGSTFHQTDNVLLKKMLYLGIHVINKFISNINEIYLLSDIYVFPVKGLEKNYFPKRSNEIGVIDMPLTIIEALACGLPVVSTYVDSFEYFMKLHGKMNIVFYNSTSSTSFISAIKKSEFLKRQNNFPSEQFSEKTFLKNIKTIYEVL